MLKYGVIDKLDERDLKILEERAAAFVALEGPQVGDYVEFACGTVRRFSYKWDDGIQTSAVNGGSYYLYQDGMVSFSGGLYPSVGFDKLVKSEEKRLGTFWFFSHNEPRAHNGVTVQVECRVWKCSSLRANGHRYDPA